MCERERESESEIDRSSTVEDAGPDVGSAESLSDGARARADAACCSSLGSWSNELDKPGMSESAGAADVGSDMTTSTSASASVGVTFSSFTSSVAVEVVVVTGSMPGCFNFCSFFCSAAAILSFICWIWS